MTFHLMLGQNQPMFRPAPFDADSLSLFARMEVQPDTSRKALIDKTIRQLKADGIWELLGFLHIQAAHHSQAGLLDWTGNGYDCTAVNAPIFTADRGFFSNGTGWVDIGAFNPTLLMLGGVGTSSTLSSSNLIGSTGGHTAISLSSPFVSPAARIWSATAVASESPAVTSGIVYLGAQREGASVKIYRAGQMLANKASTPSFGATTVGYLRWGGFISGMLSINAGFAGAALTDAQHAALYATLNHYMQEVGNV